MRSHCNGMGNNYTLRLPNTTRSSVLPQATPEGGGVGGDADALIVDDGESGRCGNAEAVIDGAGW